MVQDSCWVCGADISVEDNFCRKCGTNLVRPETKTEAGHRVVYADRKVAMGIFLVAFGAIVGIVSYFMGIVPILAFGLASALIGIIILYLPESGLIGGTLTTDSNLLNIENLLEDLDLEERGIYIPTSGLGVSPKVFVPLVLTPATKRPPLGLIHSRRIFVTLGRNPEDRGILLDAPGGGILTDIERCLSLDLSSVKSDDLKADLDSGLRSLGIGKVANINYQDDTVRIEMELNAFANLEANLRNSAPRLTAQIGTPITSAAAAAVSKATQKYVTLKSAILDLPKRKININLKLFT